MLKKREGTDIISEIGGIDSQEAATGLFGKKLDGTVLSWNHAAENIYGDPAADMIGKSIGVLSPK